jgi:hypothetical protein
MRTHRRMDPLVARPRDLRRRTELPIDQFSCFVPLQAAVAAANDVSTTEIPL